MSKRTKVGLALGSGSARGFAHVGVLRVLAAEGIPIDCITGTSIGAVIGSVYAAGRFQEAVEFLEKLDWKKVPSLLDPLFPISGMLGGKPLEKLFDKLLKHDQIEDFPLPFAAIATDVATGEEVVLTKGDASLAVRASMSLPGIFTPVFFQDRFLVDGGLVSPVPVRALKKLGADIVIAVTLSAEMSSRSYISTAQSATEQFSSIEKARISEKNTFANLLSAKYLGTGGLPEFLKGPIEKSKSFVEEQAQVFEQWIGETVEKGKAVLDGKSSLFTEWLKKEKASADLPDIFSVLFNSINIMQFEIARANLRHEPPDVLLTPDLGKIRLLDFDKANDCILEGERVAREALSKIRQTIERSM